MRTVFLGIGIVAVGVAVALLEYHVFPNRVQKLSPPTIQSSDDTSPDSISDQQQYISLIPHKYFEISGLKTERTNQTNVPHLFGQILFDPDTDNITVLKSDFFEQGKSTALVSLFEIFPQTDTTTSKTFSLIREKFDLKFRNNVESGIYQNDQFGIHSFYFNDAKNPHKTFLLGITRDRIVGFEYRKDDHQKLLPLINSLIPKIQ